MKRVSVTARDPQEAQSCRPLSRPSANIFMPFELGNGVGAQLVTSGYWLKLFGPFGGK